MRTRKQITVAINSSGAPLMVAVSDGVKTHVRRRSGIKQERLLFPALQAGLEKLGATLQDVKRVCIIRGPGRFTGIRIALTFASMLRALNKAEVYGATVFELLYMQAVGSRTFTSWKKQHPAGVLAVILHAFRDEYFLQIFDGSAKKPLWLSREELLSRLACDTRPLYLVGNDKNGSSLSELTENQYTLAPAKDCTVRADSLLALVNRPEFAQNALEPLYLKPARFELERPK